MDKASPSYLLGSESAPRTKIEENHGDKSLLSAQGRPRSARKLQNSKDKKKSVQNLSTSEALAPASATAATAAVAAGVSRGEPTYLHCMYCMGLLHECVCISASPEQTKTAQNVQLCTVEARSIDTPSKMLNFCTQF